MNKSPMNARTIAGMDSVAKVIQEELKRQNMSYSQLARLSGIERKTIMKMAHEPYYPSHFGTYIEVLDALGLKEITITWREE